MTSQILLNKNLNQTFPIINNWNYICNSYLLVNKLSNPVNFETKLTNKNPSYFFKHSVTRILNDINFPYDLRNDRIHLYFKNTDYIIRGNIIKIFININTDLFEQLLFSSMFYRDIQNRSPFYILKTYTEFIQKSYIKNIYVSNQNLKIQTANNEKNWVSNIETFFKKNNFKDFYFEDFYFPNIFNYLDYIYSYESEFIKQEDIPKNYLDKNISLNFTNFKISLRKNVEFFFNKINFGNSDYLKNFFTFKNETDFYSTIINENSYLILSNDFGDLQQLIKNNINSGLVKDETGYGDYMKNKLKMFFFFPLKNIIRISQLDLFSYNFFCITIIDNLGNNIFFDIRTNPFKNFSPHKILRLNSDKFGYSSANYLNSTTGITNPYILLENLNINLNDNFDNKNTIANCFWFNLNFDILNKFSEKLQNRNNKILEKTPHLFEFEYTFWPILNKKNITSNIKFTPKVLKSNINQPYLYFEINLNTTDYLSSLNNNFFYILTSSKNESLMGNYNGWNHFCLFTSSTLKSSINNITNIKTINKYIIQDFYINDAKYMTVNQDITNYTYNFLDGLTNFNFKIKSIYQNLHFSEFKFIKINKLNLKNRYSSIFKTTPTTFSDYYVFNLLRFIRIEPKNDYLFNNLLYSNSLTGKILDGNFENIDIDNFYYGETKDNINIMNYFNNSISIDLWKNIFNFPKGFLLNDHIFFNSKSKFINVFDKGYPFVKYGNEEILIILKFDPDYVLKAFKRNENNFTFNNEEKDYLSVIVNEDTRIIYFNDAFNEHEFIINWPDVNFDYQIIVNFNGIKDPLNIIYSNNYSKNFSIYFSTKRQINYIKYYNNFNDYDFFYKGNYKFNSFQYDFDNLEDLSKNFISYEPRSKINNIFEINYHPIYKNYFLETNKTIFDPSLIETNLSISIFDEDNENAFKNFTLFNIKVECTDISKIKENKFLDFNYFKPEDPSYTNFDFYLNPQKEGSLIINSTSIPYNAEIKGYLPHIYSPLLNTIDLQKYSNQIFINLATIVKYHENYYEENISNQELIFNFKSNFFQDEYKTGLDKKLIYYDENHRYSYMSSSNIITIKNRNNILNKNYKAIFFTIYINNPDNFIMRKFKFNDNLDSINQEEKRKYFLKVTLVNSYKLYLTYKIEIEETIPTPEYIIEQDIYNENNISFLINFSPRLNLMKRDNINYVNSYMNLSNQIEIRIYLEKIKFKNYKWNKLLMNDSSNHTLSKNKYDIEYIFSVNSILQEIIFSKKLFYNLIQSKINEISQKYKSNPIIGKNQTSQTQLSEIISILESIELRELKENIFLLKLKNVTENLKKQQILDFKIDTSTSIIGIFENSYKENSKFYFSVESRNLESIDKCDMNNPFIWIKTNMRYIEFPSYNFVFSTFENKIDLFLNPVCLAQMENNQLIIDYVFSNNSEVFEFTTYIKSIFLKIEISSLTFKYKFKSEKINRVLSVIQIIIFY